jgi:bacillopeptidase F
MRHGMRKNSFGPIWPLVLAVLVGYVLWPSFALGGKISPRLASLLSTAEENEKIPVIVTFSDRLDLSAFKVQGKRNAKAREALIRALKEKAAKSQKQATDFLSSRGVMAGKALWIINGRAIDLRPGMIRRVASLPGVESVGIDTVINEAQYGQVSSSSVGEPEWNLTAVHAPDLWDIGFMGEGTVVASIDSGVDLNHADLKDRWRGGSNSWFDPHNEHDTPYDASGHGTQTTGVVLGGDAGGSAIGMAPGAKWIAAKIFNDEGKGTVSEVHLSFQWVLDPDGNPSTDDAPDVVSSPWIISNTVNVCNKELEEDVSVLKAAGILISFAAGNEGPASGSSVSPANYQESFASGAVDASLSIFGSSSRGPSACDGSVFPEVVAPGVDVRTSDLTSGGVFPNSYATVTGTSFAASHTAGAMALLRGAFPNVPSSTLEEALIQSSFDLGEAGPDNVYGYGLLDVMEAYLVVYSPYQTGVFRDGWWHLDSDGTPGWNYFSDTSIRFGMFTDIPATGDWDGDGYTDIGVFRNGWWYLDSNNVLGWQAGEDTALRFGMFTDIPVTGDWDGDGDTDIGVFRKGWWYLDSNNVLGWQAGEDTALRFGMFTDIPVTGDWDGDGDTDVGVFRNGWWYLDSNNDLGWQAGSDDAICFGAAGDIPVTGDWDGNVMTDIGIFNYGRWNLMGVDIFKFGIAGDMPVTGKW